MTIRARVLGALAILALVGATRVEGQDADLERLRCAVLGFCPAPAEPTHTNALLYVATGIVLAGIVAGRGGSGRGGSGTGGSKIRPYLMSRDLDRSIRPSGRGKI